jgi:hypothetical protein
VMLPLGHLLHGELAGIATAIGRGALFTWAWLELFQGINYFRRALGAIVLIATVWSTVKH